MFPLVPQRKEELTCISVADPEKPTQAVTLGMARLAPLVGVVGKRHVKPERLCNVTSTKGPSSDAKFIGGGFILSMGLLSSM